MLVESFALEFFWMTVSIATSFSGGKSQLAWIAFANLVPSCRQSEFHADRS